MQFISRAYNSFELDSTGAVVIKKSKEPRLLDEISFYENLPKSLSVYFPRVFFSGTVDSTHEVGMEHYAYDNLGNLMINEKFHKETWSKIFNFIFKFINEAKNHTLDADGKVECASMFIDKTEKEYKNLVDNFRFFHHLEQNVRIELNGQSLRTFNIIWDDIKNHINTHYLTQTLNYIHGDLCFSNILYGINPITGNVVLKFIDPRGSFGNVKYYGDSYYDLAKLLHSCEGGYEYFITDNFEVSSTNNKFTLTFSNGNKSQVSKVYNSVIDDYGFDKTKIKILQGTIFIGMCARHYDSLARQKAMYLTGLKLLNEVYETI